MALSVARREHVAHNICSFLRLADFAVDPGEDQAIPGESVSGEDQAI